MIKNLTNNHKIIHVAVPIPFRHNFDYIAPINSYPIPGMRVKIPFGKKILHGVITEVSNYSKINNLKQAIEILDSKPLFSPKLLKLINWASNYYHYPLGMLFKILIPKHDYLKNISCSKNIVLKKIMNQTITLNINQKTAINMVARNFNKFSPYLLYGITGSGKTEVYIQLVKRIIHSNKQVLILVPEINLTPQIFKRFQERFSVPIALLHSQIKPSQRAFYWLKAQQGNIPIILGTRLAAFTPLKKPGLFIIDEEHDLSFKQQNQFCYSARDLLVKRAQLEKCPILLGSATPSLESWLNVDQQKYQLLCLPKKANNTYINYVEIIDIRHKKLDQGLSRKLLANIQHQLQKKSQILIFINRRGYAPVVMCFNCGWHQRCYSCDSNMIYHTIQQQILCHHCRARKDLPNNCPSCHAKINLIGQGTQSIEECLRKHFPNAKIARVDKDTTNTKDKLQNILNKVQSNYTDILIGTQMLAKGHHFPNLNLVAIIDIDSALFSTDFRTIERLGQLLTQVSGRTGRCQQGMVVLQTTQPDNPLINAILNKSYKEFISMIAQERKIAQLPPFSAQILIRAQTKIPDIAHNFLKKVKQLIYDKHANNKIENFVCLGPIAAPMEKCKGYYRAQLLLQASKRKQLQIVLNSIISKLEYDKSIPNLRWNIDVDPLEMH